MMRAFGITFLLAVGQAAQPPVETGTVHGRVNIDFPMTMHPGRQRLYTATLGLGGPKIRAVTTNGAVMVLRR